MGHFGMADTAGPKGSSHAPGACRRPFHQAPASKAPERLPAARRCVSGPRPFWKGLRPAVMNPNVKQIR